MEHGGQAEIRSDLHRSYLLLGLLTLVLGGAAAMLVRDRAAQLQRAHEIDSRFHLRTMVLCGQIREHLLEVELALERDVQWVGGADEPGRTSRYLARKAVEEVQELHTRFPAGALEEPAERLEQAQTRLDDVFRRRAGDQDDEILERLRGVKLRAEQLRRLHREAHLDLQSDLKRTTKLWLWKLTGLAGLALLVGAIVVWRIFDRSDRAVDAWQRAEAERARIYDALDASFSEAYLVEPNTLRITHASRGAAAALGAPQPKLHQMGLLDVAPELDESAVRAVAAGDRRQLIVETHHQRADGSRYPVQVSMQRVEQGGESQLLAVAMDVSDLHEARTALHQAQRVEAAGQIAGGLAHDFNNLIMVIEGHAELLRMQQSTPALRAISEASARAGALTKQLLQFSRKSIVQPVALNLNDMLADVRYLLQRLINANIKTSFEPAPTSVTVKADRGQIQQVILNLCINAQDAMPQGGALTLASGWARRTVGPATVWTDDEEGDYAYLRITDTGHGMDAETLQRIFEPFFTTKPVGRGTGLGLASVHAIVTDAEGHVAVQSEVDAGSCFSVYLPRSEEEASEYHTLDESPAAGRGNETILVVDDDDLVADLIEDVLQRKGYRVLVASDPTIALQLAEDHGDDIRLLITDLVMPEMTGYELAKRITEKQPGIGVIYISGYAPERVIPERRLDEELTFLQKPFPPRDLVQAARRVLDSRSGA